MEALRILGDEHQSLAAILHAVRFMLKEVVSGRLQPDLRLFEAMIHYLDAYPEKRHHPKEDILFARLKARTSDGAEALAELDRQHQASAERIQALEAALAAYAADPSKLADFAAAFDHYADFYRSHMMLEEREALPLARKVLTAEDWAEVDRAFTQDRDPMSGTRGKPEDFADVFSKLVAAAPAPIGLGAGPYRG